MYLDEPPTFSFKATVPQEPPPRFAKVVKAEEKGTDVGPGVHLVRDALAGEFEQGAVITKPSNW